MRPSDKNDSKGKRSGEKRDFMQVAREVVEKAIGEQMDGSPLPVVVDKRNPHAVALGDRVLAVSN